jgi:hypothetical protein
MIDYNDDGMVDNDDQEMYDLDPDNEDSEMHGDMNEGDTARRIREEEPSKAPKGGCGAMIILLVIFAASASYMIFG